jgi:2-succinyl-5-enolpyruvyl-6-hydroxy-3-cyclohexene-1-carboxylate synthase
MYNIQENVRIVVSLLKEYYVHHIVLSPGGTNIPIVQAVQDDPFFHCYSVPDERSAMYFAIGLYLQTGEVIATSCTSAQATRNYVPGLTEAFYKHTPIIAITTSKLLRYNYQEYMQAPDQMSLPQDAVKKSYDLPPVTDENTRALCCRLAKDAILEATHRNPGPVQINLRIIDSQQAEYEDVQLPKMKIVKRYMAWDNWDDFSLNDKRVLIVVGEHRVFSEKQKDAIEKFCECYNSVVYVNHLSNFHGKYTVNGNLLISSGGMRQSGMMPDVVITIGGQTGDYSIYGTLVGEVGNAEHWRVSEDGSLVDTYNRLTKIFECPFDLFFNRLSKDLANIKHNYFERWTELNMAMNHNVDIAFTNLYAAEKLTPLIPEGSYINFAILNSLRTWSYFDLKPSVKGFSNVAAFGIDGCTSVLIGESMNTDQLCFLITGDLAFFYDMNALGIRHIKNNVRILLDNNRGGGEFRVMTKNWKTKPDVAPFISAEGHNGCAKGWAENCGFEYLSASNKEEFDSLLEKFISPNEKSILLEMFTRPEDEPIAITSFLSANRIVNSSSIIKDMAKKVLGEKSIQLVKNITKRGENH